jgi:hypothetical protein
VQQSQVTGFNCQFDYTLWQITDPQQLNVFNNTTLSFHAFKAQSFIASLETDFYCEATLSFNWILSGEPDSNPRFSFLLNDNPTPISSVVPGSGMFTIQIPAGSHTIKIRLVTDESTTGAVFNFVVNYDCCRTVGMPIDNFNSVELFFSDWNNPLVGLTNKSVSFQGDRIIGQGNTSLHTTDTGFYNVAYLIAKQKKITGANIALKNSTLNGQSIFVNLLRAKPLGDMLGYGPIDNIGIIILPSVTGNNFYSGLFTIDKAIILDVGDLVAIAILVIASDKPAPADGAEFLSSVTLVGSDISSPPISSDEKKKVKKCNC